ncbi:GNAT family N-acetyltransferase [Alishewanella sp. HH-ZS]|uniref:GNAT family N-acetyltransferase n=1 Tax=Alishewanella sp. HH-ZS TaxID=1856684 RepID=UPI0008236674|nr:GNAT family N-acetyltransferase [Alishewanella sp. HH-ZS]OCW96176.1 acetyltransferase [Alishewanella sp. HH-ZS]
MQQLNIQHDSAGQRFILSEGNASALLDYQLNGQHIDFCHTYVPPEFRGKGLAEKLVRHALSWAKDNGLQIHASCSYVQRFL